MNVLFIMADQFRHDHLGCAGHPWLRTPNLDALARRGVRFSNAFVNSGVCGPSRMSYYTGRYPISHGATWNRVPLRIGEVTLGDYLRDAGLTLALAGKTHVMRDNEGLKRLAIDGQSELGTLLAHGGFKEVDRYDGHHEPGAESGYPAFLRAQGYDSADPWTDFVISGVDQHGQVQSGWNMRNVHLPARVKDEHSETPFMTGQAMRFIDGQGDQPWVLHLSYVKPHWPYMAPSPYHAMYRADQCLPVVRSQAERVDAHPVVAAYRQQDESVSFQRDDCIATVRPVYQGLITQLDDQLGRLFDFMSAKGVLDKTLVIFTADHGDFLGDHWLGEKELFYDTIQKVPFIVCDPRREADVTRGTVDGRFVESVDVVPTILDTLGAAGRSQWIEGRSLLPLLHDDGSPSLHGVSPSRSLHGGSPSPHGTAGAKPDLPWRDFVYSELDYSFREARLLLGKQPQQCRAFSIRDARWRYVYWLDEPEQLFDMVADPDQFQDLGRDAGHVAIRQELKNRLLDFLARRKHRTSVSDEFIVAGTNAHKKAGVFFGQW